MHTANVLAAMVLVLNSQPHRAAAHPGQPWTVPKELPAAIATLNADYLSGDFSAFTQDFPNAWRAAGGEELLEKNLMQFVEQAYAINKGRLPSSSVLPSAISSLRLEQRRTQDRSEIGHVVECSGKIAVGRKIAELKLVRYPNEVLLDWRDPRFKREQAADGSFYVKGLNSAPLRDGLFQVSMTLDDGTTTESWLPIVDWSSDHSPEVVEPSADQTYTNGNPHLAWKPYATQNNGFQTRTFAAEIIYNDAPDYRWDKKWALYAGDGERTECTVGREANGQGVAALGRGRHLFSLTVAETRTVGAIVIAKTSARRVAFYVR